MNFTPESVVGASPDQVSCDLGGETAILSLKTGVYYGLDAVGARIWKLIEQPRTISQVRDRLVAEYDVEPARCERDLLHVLGKLHSEGLIVVAAQQSA